MEPIKSIIGDVLKKIQNNKEQGLDEDVEKVWIKSVQKKIAKHTRIRFFKKGKLYVNAEDSAWLYELKINKEEILRKLQKFSKNKITDAIFKVGDMHGS
ncbi:MAG: DUF721 domain-containing protein [Candidatus Omnitrophota bacterium]